MQILNFILFYFFLFLNYYFIILILLLMSHLFNEYYVIKKGNFHIIEKN